MTKRISAVTLSLFAALAFALPAFGQTAMTQTRLAASSTASQRTISVASVTGIAAGTYLLIEDGTGSSNPPNVENAFVESVTGTNLTVIRGYGGSTAQAHITGAIVLAGPPNAFNAVDPTGACTPTAIPFTPYVNAKNGNQWLCSSITNSWVPGFFNTSSPPGNSPAVASVAGATLPSGPLFHVTGTNQITAWGASTTVGAVGAGGSTTDVIGASFCIIPDALGSTAAGNNIAIASTFVVNKILCYTFDQTNKKYIPSY